MVDGSPPDLVLMDINLPGMNGIEATQRHPAEHPDVAVILMSTYSEADLPADARDCGAIGVRAQGRLRSGARASLKDVVDHLNGERDRSRDRAPLPGRTLDVERAADRSEPVGHVDEPVALDRAAARVEPGAVVDDLEANVVSVSVTVIVKRALVAGVLARVLHRFEAAEVDRGFDVGRVAADIGGHVGRQHRAVRGGRSASGRPRSMSSGG